MNAERRTASTGRGAAPLRRWLIRIGWVVVGVYAFYLVGANLVLKTDVLRPVIEKKPEKMLVRWGSAHSLFPELVRVEELWVRGQTKGTQWECRLDRGDVRISLPAFLRKQVLIRSVRGEGFSCYARKRLETAREWEAVKDLVPPIEGLENPAPREPDRDDGSRDRDPEPEPENPWHIDLRDVVVQDAIDLWFGQLRIRGQGVVRGGVEKVLRGGDLTVPETSLELGSARITVGGSPLVEDVRLELTDASLTPFDPGETQGIAVMKHFSGHLRLADGRVEDIGVLRTLLPADGDFQLLDGAGRLDVDLETPEPGATSGTVALDLHDVRMQYRERPITGNVEMDLTLEEGDHAVGRYALGPSTFELREMRVDPPSPADGGDDAESAEPWHGSFTIQDGELVIRRPMRFDVESEFELEDSRPIVSTFLAKPTDDGQGSKLPLWARALPNIQDLDGEARLDYDGEAFRIRDAEVTGDKFDMLARLRFANKQVTGRLYFRYGVLHLGLELQADGRDIKLVEPKEWFLESGGAEAP